MSTVLITGGTGLIGEQLSMRLKDRGYEVAILSRGISKEDQSLTYIWDINKFEIDKEAIATADFIIHLSGSSIGEKRWTIKRKQQIIDSRIKSGQLIFDEIRKQNKNLRAFISASAIGYYGTATSNKIFHETDPPGDDFLGRTCREWEKVADGFKNIGIRTVKIRTGVVLTKQGGALSKIKIPIKAGFGSAMGTGKQYIPWIHIDDLCGIYIKAIEDTKMIGAYNAVAPEHVTNKEFTQTLATSLKKPLWFPNIPAVAMKILFGEMSEILLQGSRISAEKIQTTGFQFQFPSLEGALQQLMQ
ncbi:TIGR01777 family oxidoreductase [Bacteroidota bacterium]